MSALIAKVEEVQRLVSSGKAAQALPLAQRLLQQHPKHPDIAALMSLVCTEMAQFDRAVYFSRQALALAPDDPQLMLALGQRLSVVRQHDEALALTQRAVAARPDDPEALTQLMHVTTAAGLAEAAYQAGHRAMRLSPRDPELLLGTAHALLNLSRVADALTLLEDGRRRFPKHSRIFAGYASTLNYDGRTTPEQSLAAHGEWARLLAALPLLPLSPASPTAALAPKSAEQRVTVGILSADLRRHSVAYFLERWVSHHDRERVKIICFQLNHVADEFTKRLRSACEGWVDVSRTDGLELAQAIRREQLHVLVECNGLTEGQRLAVLACRPAPVQLTYCGYPNTLTLPWIDGRIVDSLTDPRGAREIDDARDGDSHASHERPHEPLLRLDPCFLCYTPPKDAPDPARPPCVAAQTPPTFGSFNTVQKLSDQCLALWARVLLACPGSRLIIKALNLRDASTRDALTARMIAAGIDPSHVELVGPTETSEAHLLAYARIDIALDTVPYNGTTTTCEALWMGVPVVALAGRMHHERVGVSLLTNVGLQDFIAADEDDFVRIAASLANEPSRLTTLRTTLRAQIAKSPVCNGPLFAAGMERVLREAWQRHAERTTKP